MVIKRMNKKGISALMLIAVLFISFFIIIILGVIIYGVNQVDTIFTSGFKGITIGSTNFTQAYEQNLGMAIDNFVQSMNILGIGVLFGMTVVVIFVGSYAKLSRYWLVLDIFIIVAAFILAVMLQNYYSIFINSNSALLPIYQNNLTLPSKFILSLPTITATLGALLIIFTYAILKREGPNRVNVLDYMQ